MKLKVCEDHSRARTFPGDPSSIPRLVRSPGEENGNPLQFSCLENLMDRRGWRATVHGVATVGHDLATKPPRPFSVQRE